ncbi:hypothetical protein ElyMa_001007400 [Elysia marginata]|uniref:Uncharacterized protein n=1 Tax=Elysia marginata TaxID=1093978 RepID=A0AAV4HK35_9GAST|nr:hypothetical protein ElyMa_001007400 [Elysia marginata]
MIFGKPKKFSVQPKRNGERHTWRFIVKLLSTQEKNTNKLITAAKQIYTKNKISDSKSNPKELFRIVNGLIKHSKPGADLPQSNDNRELATKFADYFDNKIENIRKELYNTNVSSGNNSSETCETSINSFRPTTEDEVKNIIKSMPNKTVMFTRCFSNLGGHPVCRSPESGFGALN